MQKNSKTFRIVYETNSKLFYIQKRILGFWFYIKDCDSIDKTFLKYRYAKKLLRKLIG